MAKAHGNIKHTDVRGKSGHGTSIEQSVSIDDSLLPDSEELEKLKQLDPTIIDWIKTRTEKEQDSRLDLNQRKIAILEKTALRNSNQTFLRIFCAFVIVMSGMGISYLLLQKDLNIAGSIFGGVTIILAAQIFLSNSRRRPTK